MNVLERFATFLFECLAEGETFFVIVFLDGVGFAGGAGFLGEVVVVEQAKCEGNNNYGRQENLQIWSQRTINKAKSRRGRTKTLSFVEVAIK